MTTNLTCVRARRPSPAMALACVALFVSLGGVGWAATQLPAGSVGTRQLRNGAVTGRKLAARAVSGRNLQPGSVGRNKLGRGAVGLLQVDARAVQARVTGTCRSGAAIAAITQAGGVGCAQTLPLQTTAGPGAVITLSPGSAATVASVRLPGGSAFLAFADPQVTIAGSPGQGVRVDCTISASTTRAVRTHNLRVEAGPDGQPLAGAIPLALAVPAGGATVAVGCIDSFAPPGSAAPTVTVQSAIDALQVQSGS